MLKLIVFSILTLFLMSCSNDGKLVFSVKFPDKTKVLSVKEKEELKKKAELTLKNLDGQDLDSGVLEVTIK